MWSLIEFIRDRLRWYRQFRSFGNSRFGSLAKTYLWSKHERVFPDPCDKNDYQPCEWRRG